MTRRQVIKKRIKQLESCSSSDLRKEFKRLRSMLVLPEVDLTDRELDEKIKEVRVKIKKVDEKIKTLEKQKVVLLVKDMVFSSILEVTYE